mgnify:CR=1 FL=1
MKSHSKRKLHLLAVKLHSLKEELKVSKEILIDAAAEVDKMFQEIYFPEKPSDNEESPKDLSDGALSTKKEQANKFSDPEKDSKQPPDLETKKLFRKIALEIHPDRLVGLPDGAEKNKKKQLFQKSMDALEDNDLIILVSIAIELGIDPPEVSEERLLEAENKIITIKKELQEIESKYVWHWFFCSCLKKKNKILQKIFDIMYEQRS